MKLKSHASKALKYINRAVKTPMLKNKNVD
jgi:hypothetical protein